MIVLYSSSSCPACTGLKRFLNKKNVKFKEIDILKNKKGAEEMIKKSGQDSYPVLDVNGNIIIGFKETDILEALK